MNQHKARASHARSDVAQFLNLGYQDRALLRVKLQPFSSDNNLFFLRINSEFQKLLKEVYPKHAISFSLFHKQTLNISFVY